MSTNVRQPLVNTWLGFDPNKPIHAADYDFTLDDLVASLLSNKRAEPKLVRLVLIMPELDPDPELELFIHVRGLTQIYTPVEYHCDPSVIESFYAYPEWGMEGWIKRGNFNPSFNASAVRCFFHSEESGRLIEEAEVQFITPLEL